MQIKKINSKTSFYKIQFVSDEYQEKGIYYTEMRGNDKKGYFPETIFISTLIYIQQKIRSENAVFYKVVFFDNDKEQVKFIKASSLFNESSKDSPELISLIDNGLIISNKCKAHLIDYLKSQSREVIEIQGTNYMGWHESGEYIANGFSTTNNIVFTGSSSFIFQEKGDKELFKKKYLEIYSENPLVFAINSYMNSAYFLKFLGNEMNQTLSLNGTTSKGKSTACKMGLASGTNPKNFKNLNSTKGNLQSILKHSNHSKTFFDEVAEAKGTMKKEDKVAFVYAVANGSERGRLHKSLDNNSFVSNDVDNDKKELFYTVVIAGEESFLQGVDTKGSGLDARYLEILLPEDIPLWNSITTPEEAEELDRFIHNNYGHIDKDFINLVNKRKELIEFEYQQKLFEIREEYDDSNNLFKRKIRILAYTYVSSLLLGELLSNSVEVAHKIADNAFDIFKRVLLSETDKEESDKYKETLSHFQDTLYKYLEDKTSSSDSQHVIKRLGYYHFASEYKEFTILSNAFSEVCSILGVDEKLFIAYLKAKKLLDHEAGRNTKKVMINSARASYYVIKLHHKFFEEIKEPEEFDDELKQAWYKDNKFFSDDSDEEDLKNAFSK